MSKKLYVLSGLTIIIITIYFIVVKFGTETNEKIINVGISYFNSMIVAEPQQVIIDSQPFTIASGYYAYVIKAPHLPAKNKLRVIMYTYNNFLAVGDTVEAVLFNSANGYGYFLTKIKK